MDIIKKITDDDIIGSTGLSNRSPKILARAILFDNTGKIALVYVKKISLYNSWWRSK